MGLKLSSNKTPSFTFSNLPASVDEGQNISPIVSIANIDNTIIDNANLSVNAYWEISGVGIASTDFENVGADGNPDSGTTLTGYVNLTGTTTSKQFPIGIRSDNFADLNVNETATFSLYSDAARTELIQSDTFIINDTSMGEPEFDFLLVGGGGRGGRSAGGTTAVTSSGGGGAGGVLVVNNEVITLNQVIYCEVAATGTDNFGPGNNTYLRQNTSGGTILHYIKGGGKGSSDGYTSSTNAAGYNANPFGASGGGGCGWQIGGRSGASSGSYGNGGGDGGSSEGGGGGGGFGSAGEDYVDATFPFVDRGGNGGSGYSLSNFFSELTGTIAGGGGGAGAYFLYNGGSTTSNAGTGSAGGGDGGYQGSDGGNATDNTGSGGGGASPSYSGSWPSHTSVAQAGGTGGSGVIYLKYIAPESLFTYTGTQTVNSYIISSGGGTKKYWIHKITGSGTLTRTS